MAVFKWTWVFILLCYAGAVESTCVVPDGHTDPEIFKSELRYLVGSHVCDDFGIFNEVLNRCEQRFCCMITCSCDTMNLLPEGIKTCTGSHPRSDAVELECYVQHTNHHFNNTKCCHGYQATANFTCIDINECDQDPCRDDQECINEDGSYTCVCRQGYVTDPDNDTRCIDVDECANDTLNRCGIHDCVNTLGDYYCVCKAGYILDSSRHICLETLAVQGCKIKTPRYVYILVSLATVFILLASAVLFLQARRWCQRKALTPVVAATAAFDNATYGDASRVTIEHEAGTQPAAAAAAGGEEELYEKIPSVNLTMDEDYDSADDGNNVAYMVDNDDNDEKHHHPGGYVKNPPQPYNDTVDQTGNNVLDTDRSTYDDVTRGTPTVTESENPYETLTGFHDNISFAADIQVDIER